MSISASLFLSSLLVCAVTPMVVQGCSCVEGAFSVSRSTAIRSELCASYNTDVYIGTVIGATCNCIPRNQPEESDVSAFLNCQQYQMVDSSPPRINATILTQGECAFERIDDLLFTSESGDGDGTCSGLRNILSSSSGLNVEAPSAIDDELLNLTMPFETCRFACPFNVADDYPYIRQPCVYNVRVMEVFKGSYSVGDEITTTGPDVLTSCGDYGRVLEINLTYVAGIGQACSPISQWEPLCAYEEQEIELLRRIREEEVECGAIATVVSVTMVMTFALITAIM